MTAPSSTPTLAPSATPTVVHTPTATLTLIPTLPPEQAGVPDPRATDPELFDLRNPDAPIPQFVNAMQMVSARCSERFWGRIRL